jgi:hypothetical protein
MKTNDFISNPDELVNLVKLTVDNILSKYIAKYDIVYATEELRDDTVYHVVHTILKKYVNDSRYQNKKEFFINHIANDYLFKIYLENQK